jgi:hypothetical protein
MADPSKDRESKHQTDCRRASERPPRPESAGASLPDGWITNPDGVRYPPEPWYLAGTLHVSVWWIPVADLPPLPQGLRPKVLLGRALIGTAWAVYELVGVLAYNELLAALPVSRDGRRFITIPRIWVDHPSSAAGGRTLWGIPKQLATFQVRVGPPFEGSAETDGQAIASLRFHPDLTLPGRWRVSVRTIQMLAGCWKIAEARSRARVQFGRAAWGFAASGPLGFLAGRKPLFSIRLADMEIRFGL